MLLANTFEVRELRSLGGGFLLVSGLVDSVLYFAEIEGWKVERVKWRQGHDFVQGKAICSEIDSSTGAAS